MKSRPETASIEFGATSGESQLACHLAPVGVEVHPGQSAGAERESPGLTLREGEARAIRASIQK